MSKKVKKYHITKDIVEDYGNRWIVELKHGFGTRNIIVDIKDIGGNPVDGGVNWLGLEDELNNVYIVIPTVECIVTIINMEEQ